MTAEVDIYNLALGACGAEEAVSSPSESSRPAELCALWYPVVRDQILRAAYWPSCKKSARLALIVERDEDIAWAADAPDPGWRYLYAAPSDMLAPRFISNYARFELTATPANAKGIVTNVEDAILTYTSRNVTIDTWDVGLRMAIIYGLAAHIVMPLTGKMDRVQWIANSANSYVTQARVDSANTNEAMVDSIPDWILARGYAGVAPPTRYIYPLGPMIAFSEGVGVT